MATTTTANNQTRAVWQPTDGFKFLGLGPAGLILAAITSLMVAYQLIWTTGAGQYMRALVAALVGLFLIILIGIRDRHGRTWFNRFVIGSQFVMADRFGRTWFSPSWLTRSKFARIELPGHNNHVVVGEQNTGHGPVAVVHWRRFNRIAFSFTAESNWDPLDGGEPFGYIEGFEKFLNQQLGGGHLNSVAATLTTRPYTVAEARVGVNPWLADNNVGQVFVDITEQQGGSPVPEVTITCVIAPKLRFGNTRSSFPENVTDGLVNSIIDQLHNAGAVNVAPVDTAGLRRRWAAHFNPAAAGHLAERPDMMVPWASIRPMTAVEKPWGWHHGGGTTVSAAMSSLPAGDVTPRIFEAFTDPVDVAARSAVTVVFENVSHTERQAYNLRVRYGSALTEDNSRMTSGATVVAKEDVVETEKQVARGQSLVRVQVLASATAVRELERSEADSVGLALAARIGGALNVFALPASRGHQSVAAASMPAGLPYESAINPLTDFS